jgi:hypothetical protein
MAMELIINAGAYKQPDLAVNLQSPKSTTAHQT